MKKLSLPYYIDEPLMIAHLLGGANGVDLSQDIPDTEIARRVTLAIKYGREIRRQLTLNLNQTTSSFAKATEDTTKNL
jgi:hypothetical protein